jgi:hypothetical protein
LRAVIKFSGKIQKILPQPERVETGASADFSLVSFSPRARCDRFYLTNSSQNSNQSKIALPTERLREKTYFTVENF